MSSASPDSSHHCGDRKIKAVFFYPKNPTFKSFQTKKTSLTPLKQLQNNPSIQNTKKSK
jgi:hypothetical protein